MINYRKILVAIELNPSSDALILKKAEELKEQCHSELFLMHIIESMANYGAAYGIVVGVDIEQALREEAQKTIEEVGKKLQVPISNQIVRIGSPGRTILEEAEDRKIDLIVVGSHGRHGVRLLLGSTANSVLHGAKCDVLAVRLQNE